MIKIDGITITKEALKFALDNLSQYLTGIPTDYGKWNLLAYGLTFTTDANAPTVYSYDSNGHMVPVPGRSVSAEEQKWMDDRNATFDRLKPIQNKALDDFLNQTLPLSFPSVAPLTSTDYHTATAALNWVAPRRDPLVLDLDGNGITTSGINPSSPILFDQDGDGTLTATGWIASGEAIVVRDLNGNGLIDSGRELFGDNTILTRGPNAGQTAANGFAALADLDANASGVADGKFDAGDVAFSSVKLWKDLNQDGVSQSNELFTFARLGIQSISVTGTASNIDLGGGNTQAFSGSFTRTTGQTGASGTAELAGSLLLANNNFYRQFTDDPALTAAAQALPQMTGSGLLRDLRPANRWAGARKARTRRGLTMRARHCHREMSVCRFQSCSAYGGTANCACDGDSPCICFLAGRVLSELAASIQLGKIGLHLPPMPIWFAERT